MTRKRPCLKPGWRSGTWEQLYRAGYTAVRWPSWNSGAYLQLYKNDRNELCYSVKDAKGLGVAVNRDYRKWQNDGRWVAVEVTV